MRGVEPSPALDRRGDRAHDRRGPAHQSGDRLRRHRHQHRASGRGRMRWPSRRRPGKRIGLPCVDPIRTGVGPIVDLLQTALSRLDAEATVAHESWPIAGSFTISRGSKTTADVVVVTLEEDGVIGPRRMRALSALRRDRRRRHRTRSKRARPVIEAGLHAGADCQPRCSPGRAERARLRPVGSRGQAHPAIPSGSSRVCTRRNRSSPPITLSLDTPEAMADGRRSSTNRPLLKLKLGREGDVERLQAIRKAAPDSRLIVDANEGWSPDDLPAPPRRLRRGRSRTGRAAAAGRHRRRPQGYAAQRSRLRR